jgi:hypothetical protein
MKSTSHLSEPFRKGRRLFAVWLLLCLLLPLVQSHGAEKEVPEYRLKAVYMLNFLRFTVWPQESFGSTNSPFVIGILGDDPFGNELKTAISGELIDGRKIEIQHFQKVEDGLRSHLLFISKSHRLKIGTILEACKGTPVLTVSEVEDFARRGGMINMVLNSGKVDLLINLKSAREVGINITSQLSRRAREIFPPQGGP